jgi:hypothetical protein
MRRTLLACSALALLLASAPQGMAHHSPAAFNLTVTDFAISGEIEFVEMRNPHSVMKLRVANDDGSEMYMWSIVLADGTEFGR